MTLMVAGMAGARKLLFRSDLADPEEDRFASELWALTKGHLVRQLVRVVVGRTR